MGWVNGQKTIFNVPINYPPEFKVRGKFKYIEEISQKEQNVFYKDLIQKSYQGCNNLFFKGDKFSPEWENNWFLYNHVQSLMGVLNHHRPKSILEIGSGWSTKFSVEVIKDLGLKTHYKIIDPCPRSDVSSIVDENIPSKLEDVNNDGILEGVDLVFFDGSHRCFQNSDVTVFFMEIIPQLRPGMVVGIHDIFLPQDYPEKWVTRYYNEQYILGSYLIGARDKIRVAMFGGILWFQVIK